MNTLLRRAVPYTLLPLSLIACVLASTPWLRAFPSDVISVPLFGAALLSVLAPVIVVGIGVRRLWLSALIDVVLFVFYQLLVTLREPAGFHNLYLGLVHGPAQILSFALPLVSPRTLLVAPVALCWLSGALIGECIARGWHTVLPYLTLLVTFGLSYAATARAVTSSADGRRYDTILAAALLLVLLLLRAAQAWVVQDQGAEMTQPEGVLPLRGLAVGAVLSVAVAAVASAAVQSSAFAGNPVTPARVPPIDQARPLTPVAFVAGLRPDDPKASGPTLFKVSVDRPTSNYVAIATVDYYDGDSWSFSRTFRPSGGVIPADPDPTMRAHGPQVMQQYQIANGPMTSVPWMPHLDRAAQVTGVSVDIDSTTGMIVPAAPLHAGDEYTVMSAVPDKTFDQLGKKALVGTSASPVDTSLADGLSTPLGTLVNSLAAETGTPSADAVQFLQAVARQFRAKDALATAASGPHSANPSPSGSASGNRFVGQLPGLRPTSHPHKRRHTTHSHRVRTPTTHGHPTAPHTPTGTATPTPPTSTPSSPSPSNTGHSGGTTFADVLASIRGAHSGTPEQFATLTALIARQLGIPAEVVSGFRIPLHGNATSLPEGSYRVTASDAWTWVEIPVRGLGWVVLDPSPSHSKQVTPPPSAAAHSPSPSPSPSQTAQLTHSNNGGHAAAPPSRIPHAEGLSALAVVAIVLLAVLFLLVALLIFLLGRKRVRARRRQRGDPRRRLVGAWQESIDVLVESGLRDLTYATSAEVADATASRFGGEPAGLARTVGEAANRAIFSVTTPIAVADADAAWRAEALLRRSVRRRLDWRNRISAGLRYNRPRRTKPAPAPSSWAEAAKARTASRPGKHTRAAQRRRSAR